MDIPLGQFGQSGGRECRLNYLCLVNAMHITASVYINDADLPENYVPASMRVGL